MQFNFDEQQERKNHFQSQFLNSLRSGNFVLIQFGSSKWERASERFHKVWWVLALLFWLFLQWTNWIGRWWIVTLWIMWSKQVTGSHDVAVVGTGKRKEWWLNHFLVSEFTKCQSACTTTTTTMLWNVVRVDLCSPYSSSFPHHPLAHQKLVVRVEKFDKLTAVPAAVKGVFSVTTEGVAAAVVQIKAELARAKAMTMSNLVTDQSLLSGCEWMENDQFCAGL